MVAAHIKRSSQLRGKLEPVQDDKYQEPLRKRNEASFAHMRLKMQFSCSHLALEAPPDISKQAGNFDMEKLMRKLSWKFLQCPGNSPHSLVLFWRTRPALWFPGQCTELPKTTPWTPPLL